MFAFIAPDGLASLSWAYLRLLRVPSRVLQIRKFFINWLAELEINLLYVRLSYTLTRLALWMHFFCCLAYFIGDCPFVCQGETSWMKFSILSKPDRTFAEKYIVALYFICNTMTSTGYGDIVATSSIDRAFSLLVQLVGKSFVGFVIGDFSSALANGGISRQNFESRFQTMKMYLLDQQADRAIISRVQNYFNFLWKTSRGTNDINSVLADAPFPLRTDISFAVHKKDLRQVG
jgi:hypothetical protein